MTDRNRAPGFWPGAGPGDPAPSGQQPAGTPSQDEPLVTPREDAEPEAPGTSAEVEAESERAGETAAETPAAAADELEAIAEQAAKAEEYLALAQRKQAEFENFRKRAARDAATAQERGATRLATALLPAVDNLERALEHAPQDADTPDGAQAITAFVAGVRHVHSDLVAALAKSGIEQYSPEGELFDPVFHEAVAQQPIEGQASGTVVEVFQRGYRIGETVVRPARVLVAA